MVILKQEEGSSEKNLDMQDAEEGTLDLSFCTDGGKVLLLWHARTQISPMQP
jgi:hypothetical protein